MAALRSQAAGAAGWVGGAHRPSRGSVSFRRMSVVFLAFFGKRGVASLGGGWGELL